MPRLLSELRLSLLVTTYEAGKLVILRSDGTTLNAHFRVLERPMGVGAQGARLAVGCKTTINSYVDVPAVAAKLEGKHDACFIPRALHYTGEIDVHDVALDPDGNVWFVNTAFSCVCTLAPDASFVPRWRPPFVSSYTPNDHCHLNGLCLAGGAPKYVTALGETDSDHGWRETMASGGLLYDVALERTLLRGLSMPHSPRIHAGRIWFLESGHGALCEADPVNGTYRTVARLPGITRGLAFAGPLAFVGLSTARKQRSFGGLPILESGAELVCGVYVVHLETGQVVGLVRFDGGVNEIFAIEVLRGVTFPELLDPGDSKATRAYVLPEAALAADATPSS
jgi:uncharacterized protein (TIGR03032 family)